MEKYIIKEAGKDFIFLPNINMKGTREKKLVLDVNNNQIAIFKYQKYECTEACSEKLSYEIAKLLQYKCAKVELAKDENGEIGILNYLFVDNQIVQHTDATAYINNNGDRKQFYTLENIENCLNQIDKDLFKDLIKIMVFDTFVGETDRHEENWGITLENGKYQISPLYDNGCNLLRELKDENKLKEYLEGNKNFESYINKSPTLIYNSETGKKYTHFELIKKLKENYEKEIKNEIQKIGNISNAKLEEIVNKIPNELMNDMHKQLIIKYLTIRKQKMLKIIE